MSDHLNENIERGIFVDLLFKREQTPGKLAKVQFKLWGKIELDEDEQAIVKRYRFDEAVLIAALQPSLLRRALLLSLVATAVALALLYSFADGLGVILALIIGPGIGYNYFQNKRETIFVKDLLHGRHFTCDSVVELARKEAWLTTVVGFLLTCSPLSPLIWVSSVQVLVFL